MFTGRPTSNCKTTISGGLGLREFPYSHPPRGSLISQFNGPYIDRDCPRRTCGVWIDDTAIAENSLTDRDLPMSSLANEGDATDRADRSELILVLAFNQIADKSH